MRAVFILGPGHWEPAAWAGRPPAWTPLEMRRSIADIFADFGHRTILMEDEPEKPGEDPLEKFLRLLTRRRVTDCVFYWPAGAKMQTTFDEMLLLRTRIGKRLPEVWYIHDARVAEISAGRFVVIEPGGRSRYLEALARLPAHARPFYGGSPIKAATEVATRLARS